MPSIDLEVHVDSNATLKALSHFESLTSPNSMRQFLKDFAQPYFRGRINARFASEGDSAVGKWKELTYATARIREFQGFHPFHPINRRTGAMQSFLTSSFSIDSFGYGSRLRIPGSLTGEMRKKVSTAQQGSIGQSGREMGPNRPAPPRPVLAIDLLDLRAISEGLLEWITEGGVF